MKKFVYLIFAITLCSCVEEKNYEFNENQLIDDYYLSRSVVIQMFNDLNLKYEMQEFDYGESKSPVDWSKKYLKGYFYRNKLIFKEIKDSLGGGFVKFNKDFLCSLDSVGVNPMMLDLNERAREITYGKIKKGEGSREYLMSKFISLNTYHAALYFSSLPDSKSYYDYVKGNLVTVGKNSE